MLFVFQEFSDNKMHYLLSQFILHRLINLTTIQINKSMLIRTETPIQLILKHSIFKKLAYLIWEESTFQKDNRHKLHKNTTEYPKW